MMRGDGATGFVILSSFLLLGTSSADPLGINTTVLDTRNSSRSYHSSLRPIDHIADYVLQGLDQPETSTTAPTSDTMVDLISNPLPSTGLVLNATWSTTVVDASTQRPDDVISWSSNMPKVEKCWSDIVAWRSSSVDWWNKHYADRTISGPTSTSTYFSTFNTTIETTLYPSSVSAYTLCDGSPRVDVNPVTKTLINNITNTYSNKMIANITFPDWDVPQPCDPSPETCRMWYYHSNVLDINEGELLSQCGRPTNRNESCVIRGGPIELIYWPVPPKDDICENNATLLPSSTAFAPNATVQPDVPATITTLGHTFTGGTVYLSFSTLYASWDGFWDHVGPDFSDLIVPLPSSSLFTQCGGQRYARNHGTPLDFADLNWPVPASAYSCQARCDPVGEPICPDCSHTAIPTTRECGTIWSDINPNLAMPTEIRDLVPEWSTCLMYNDRIPNFWFDPPIALTQKTQIIAPTTPHLQPTSEPAAPSSTVHSAIPVETASNANDPSTSLEKDVPASAKPTSAAETAAPTFAVDSTRQAAAQSHNKGASVDDISSNEAQPSSVVHGESTTTSSSLASAPISSRASRGSLFTYDPIVSSHETVSGKDSSSSASLDALSVLESALSALSTTITSVKPSYDPSDIVDTSSKTTAPLIPTSSHEPEQPKESTRSGHLSQSTERSGTASSAATRSVAVIRPSSYSSDSLSSWTATSGLPSDTSSAQETYTTSTAPGTHSTHIPDIESEHSSSARPSSAGTQGISSADFPTVETSSPSVLTAGSVTITAEPAGSESHATSVAGTTLSIGGDAVTLEQGSVISYASDGLVVADSSGSTSRLTSTATTDGESSTATVIELPSVVQGSGAAESDGDSGAAAGTSDASQDGGQESMGVMPCRLNMAWVGILVVLGFGL